MRPTVVVVDDHALFRSQVRRVLEADGLEVVGEAADGQSAMRAVLELRPAIVLLDVDLPGMSGLEVARRLACIPDPPAIVLTSAHDVSDFGPCVRRSPARGFIPKAELSGPGILGLFRRSAPGP